MKAKKSNRKSNTKRRPIPIKTQLKLWVATAGRCEFLGCNKMVWRDNLTLQEDNYSHIAHIISWTPTGPRGDSELSSKLAQDFSNLMLMCLEHSKLIDGRQKDKYTVDMLKSFKQEHERRIQLQTSLADNMKTTVVRFMANIGDRRMNIPAEQVQQAVLSLPRYPDEHEILIDLTDFPGRGNKNYWLSQAKEIHRRFSEGFGKNFNRSLPNHLSVFALGPIPLLVRLGNTIGNITPSDLYQKHRDTDDWIWKSVGNPVGYKVLRSNQKHGSNDVALLLSVSGKVQRKAVKEVFNKEIPLYEIRADQPDVSVLSTISALIEFRKIYRAVMNEIRDQYGHDSIVHLFPAIPAPIAVACGQDLLPKVDPHLLVYDYDHQNGGFAPTLKIN